jgi:adenylate kinase family enzyme
MLKDLNNNLTDDHDRNAFIEDINSRLGIEPDRKDDVYTSLKILHKRGWIDDGDSRLLSRMAEKIPSKEEKLKEVIQKYEASCPDNKAAFVGRDNDVKKVVNVLKNPHMTVPGINLFGESGVGKTTLAKQVSKQFEGFEILSVDLRKIKEMKTVYYLTISTFDLPAWNCHAERIYMHLKKDLTKKTLVIFDNVEQLLKDVETREEFTGFLQAVIESKACTNKTLKFILTSQVQVNESSLKRKLFTEYKVEPLEKNVSKEFISKRGKDSFDIKDEKQDEALSKISELCRDIPYLLQGAEQLMRENYCTPVQVLDKITTQIEKGVPKEIACISALFDAIPNDDLKQFAVKISLLCRPFSVSTAMKIAEMPSDYDSKWALELLVIHKIVTAKDVKGKTRYDTHGLFKDFVKSYLCKEHPSYKDTFKSGEKQVFEHFSGKLTKLADSLEADFVKTYSKLEGNRANFELTIEISHENKETFELLLHSDEHNKFALMGILFEVLKDGHERRELYAKWADAAEKQGNLLYNFKLKSYFHNYIINMYMYTYHMYILFYFKTEVPISLLE